jgi:hypothetical protein
VVSAQPDLEQNGNPADRYFNNKRRRIFGSDARKHFQNYLLTCVAGANRQKECLKRAI